MIPSPAHFTHGLGLHWPPRLVQAQPFAWQPWTPPQSCPPELCGLPADGRPSALRPVPLNSCAAYGSAPLYQPPAHAATHLGRQSAKAQAKARFHAEIHAARLKHAGQVEFIEMCREEGEEPFAYRAVFVGNDTASDTGTDTGDPEQKQAPQGTSLIVVGTGQVSRSDPVLYSDMPRLIVNGSTSGLGVPELIGAAGDTPATSRLSRRSVRATPNYRLKAQLISPEDAAQLLRRKREADTGHFEILLPTPGCRTHLSTALKAPGYRPWDQIVYLQVPSPTRSR